MTHYFTNLRTNLGDNPKFFCVYVALAMQLTYFDTYYNDDIIPEEYDVCENLYNNYIDISDYANNFNSPGIASNLPDNAADFNRISSDEDFMVRLGANVGLYELGVQNMYISGAICSALNNTGLSGYFDVSDPSRGGVYENENWTIRDYIKDKIDKGFPVMVGGIDHVTVAFAYDEDGVIYAHNGFKEENDRDEPRLVAIAPDATIRCAITLVPTEELQHNCSNNYVYEDSEGNKTYHCPCELAEHPAHEHSWSDYSITGSEHTRTCNICYSAESGNHSLSYTYKDPDLQGNHIRECICGVHIIEPHDHQYLYADYMYHYYYCYCGVEILEEHEPKYYCTNGITHLATCVCTGIRESHIMIEVIIDGETKWICDTCGHPYYCEDIHTGEPCG